MNELIQLYLNNKHTTDKWGTTVDKHTYLQTYGEIFERMKERNNRILEIGVYKGDSLNLWAEYFMQSVIYGIEHDYPQEGMVGLNKRVRIIEGNAYTPEMVTLLESIGKFDVIIDDGSHWLYHQKFVIDFYCDLLTDDGILIIEDVNSNVDVETRVRYSDMLINWFPEEVRKFAYIDDRRAINNNMADTLVIYNKHEKGRDSM